MAITSSSYDHKYYTNMSSMSCMIEITKDIDSEKCYRDNCTMVEWCIPHTDTYDYLKYKDYTSNSIPSQNDNRIFTVTTHSQIVFTAVIVAYIITMYSIMHTTIHMIVYTTPFTEVVVPLIIISYIFGIISFTIVVLFTAILYVIINDPNQECSCL